jgi:hypothetical protein
MAPAPKGRWSPLNARQILGPDVLSRSNCDPYPELVVLSERQRHSIDLGLLAAVWIAVLVAVGATLLLTL